MQQKAVSTLLAIIGLTQIYLINCDRCLLSWTPWSESDCNPCTLLATRVAKIVSKPSQNTTLPCPTRLSSFSEIDADLCGNATITTNDTQYCKAPDCKNIDGLLCSNDRCIPKNLKCNCDQDCPDNADETCSANRHTVDEQQPKGCPTCRGRDGRQNTLIPDELFFAGKGLNAITGKFADANMVAMNLFGGECRQILIGNRTYRLPYNTRNYFQSSAIHFTSEVFYSVADFISGHQKPKLKTLAGQVFSVAMEPHHHSSMFGASSEMLEALGDVNKANASLFIKLSMHVHKSIFTNRLKNTLLSMPFARDSREAMGLKYNYFHIFETYGTHFLAKGAAGGIYTEIYLFTNATLASMILGQSKWIFKCFETEFKAKIMGTVYERKRDQCTKQLKEMLQVSSTQELKNTKEISKLLGGLQSVPELGDSTTAMKWMASLNTAMSVIISGELISVCNFLLEQHGYEKCYKDCKRHLQSYFEHFNTKGCTCSKDREPFFAMGTCRCLSSTVPAPVEPTTPPPGKNPLAEGSDLVGPCKELKQQITGGICYAKDLPKWYKYSPNRRLVEKRLKCDHQFDDSFPKSHDADTCFKCCGLPRSCFIFPTSVQCLSDARKRFFVLTRNYRVDFYEASSFCKKVGGHLGSIHSAETERRIMELYMLHGFLSIIARVDNKIWIETEWRQHKSLAKPTLFWFCYFMEIYIDGRVLWKIAPCSTKLNSFLCSAVAEEKH